MFDNDHVLISLESRHANNIFAGRKHVELRRRTMNVAPGTVLWIYVKLPVGSITGYARVANVHKSPPISLWKRFSATSGLSKKEFFEYFEGIENGFALELEGAMLLQKTLPLEQLRNLAVGFHPPQFFSRLDCKHPIVDAASACL